MKKSRKKKNKNPNIVRTLFTFGGAGGVETTSEDGPTISPTA